MNPSSRSKRTTQTTTDDILRRKLALHRHLLKLDAPNELHKFITLVRPDYQCKWFHKVIADHCQMLYEGKIKNLMVFVPPQHGKALDVETPVLTANRGWVRHGDLRPGDRVYDRDGNLARVLASTPHYEWDCHRVSFAEGEPLIASFNHEWDCIFVGDNAEVSLYIRMETDEIRRRMDKEGDAFLLCERSGVHPITAIEPCGKRMVNCIQVVGGYYLAGRELRPTHNSEIISRCFPAWVLGKNPDIKIVGTSYAADLATAFSRSIQRIMDSPEYREIFPETYLNGSNVRTMVRGYLRNVDIFETVGHSGFYKAVGVGGALTGTPADIAIIDDPVKNWEEANSISYRETAWEWYVTALQTRLHNNSKRLFIMTRWHEDDLAGRILRKNPEDWTVLTFPAICEKEGDGGYSKRKVGEALWEERHGLEKLLSAKREAPREFNALYQQRPVVEGGNIVHRDWFQHVSYEQFKSLRFDEPVHFYLDTAYARKQQKADNDPSGILAACRIGKNVYVLHAQEVWKDMPDLLRFIPEYIRSHHGDNRSVLHVEPKANGISVIQMLKEISTLNVRRTPTPTDSKEVRLKAVSPRIECGRVYLVDGSWTEDFMDEVCGFPAQPHDEFVDILGYAINDLYHEDERDWSNLRNPFR